MIAPSETRVPPRAIRRIANTSSTKRTVSQETKDGHVPTPTRTPEEYARRNGLFPRESEDMVDTVAEFGLLLRVGIVRLYCSERSQGFLSDLGHFAYRFLGLVGQLFKVPTVIHLRAPS